MGTISEAEADTRLAATRKAATGAEAATSREAGAERLFPRVSTTKGAAISLGTTQPTISNEATGTIAGAAGGRILTSYESHLNQDPNMWEI